MLLPHVGIILTTVSMRALIVEDENPSAERLANMLNGIDSSINIIAKTGSVKDSVKWLKENKQPDLIFLDIQLSDGVSLDIFKRQNITCPVIFTTAYDEYILEAFDHNGIDYLLKPIKKEKLKAALDKYHSLKKHFTDDFFNRFDNFSNGKSRERLTVKDGTNFMSIKTEEVAYFFTEYKLVFLVAFSGKKYLVEKNLTELEDELNSEIFFRVNRKYLVNVNAIDKFKPFFKGKLLIDLKPKTNDEVTVSQERAAEFKEWIGK